MPAPLVVAAGGVLINLLDPFIRRLIDLIPNPAAREAALAEWMALAVQVARESDERQARLNELEAQSGSLFKAGWRPFLCWACALGFIVQTVLNPLLGWALSMWAPGTPFPTIDSASLSDLLYLLLGFAGYRTVEKFRR